MTISSNKISTQHAATFYVLNSANEQPKLALQLILKSMEGLQGVPEARTSSKAVPANATTPSSSSAIGQNIDIVV